MRQAANFKGPLEFHALCATTAASGARIPADDIGEPDDDGHRAIEPEGGRVFPGEAEGAVRRAPARPGARHGDDLRDLYPAAVGGRPGGSYVFDAFKPGDTSILMAEATMPHKPEVCTGHDFQIALQRENTALI